MSSKDDYKKIFSRAYRGELQDTDFNNEDFDEDANNQYWEWTFCYVFNNPDAQKKELLTHKYKAFDNIIKLFKQTPHDNELERIKIEEAHKEVLREVNSSIISFRFLTNCLMKMEWLKHLKEADLKGLNL